MIEAHDLGASPGVGTSGLGGMMDRAPLEKLLPVGAAIASTGAALYLARKLLSRTEWVQVISRSVMHGFLLRRGVLSCAWLS